MCRVDKYWGAYVDLKWIAPNRAEKYDFRPCSLAYSHTKTAKFISKWQLRNWERWRGLAGSSLDTPSMARQSASCNLQSFQMPSCHIRSSKLSYFSGCISVCLYVAHNCHAHFLSLFGLQLVSRLRMLYPHCMCLHHINSSLVQNSDLAKFQFRCFHTMLDLNFYPIAPFDSTAASQASPSACCFYASSSTICLQRAVPCCPWSCIRYSVPLPPKPWTLNPKP